MDFNGAGNWNVPRPQYPKDFILYPVPNIFAVYVRLQHQTEAVNSVNMTAVRIHPD